MDDIRNLYLLKFIRNKLIIYSYYCVQLLNEGFQGLREIQKFAASWNEYIQRLRIKL